MLIDSLWEVTFLGFFAGVVGTGIGGFSTFLLDRPSNRRYSFVLGFSGGLMIAIVCFDLLPEAFSTGIYIPVLGIIFGVVLIMAIDQMITYYFSNNKITGNFLKTGILMGLSIAAHNFPEGLGDRV